MGNARIPTNTLEVGKEIRFTVKGTFEEFGPAHQEDLLRPGWCFRCGCAYPCPGSVVPTPVEPVSLTRRGFMLGR